MLHQALAVVEAARELKLIRNGRRTASELDRLSLALALEGLREALEWFDRETAQGMGTPSPGARPEFATPPQLDDTAFVEQQTVIEHRLAPEAVSSGAPPAPAAEEPLPEREHPRTASFSPHISIPAASLTAAVSYINTSADLSDVGFDDGVESVSDFLEALDNISDALEYAVKRVGWTPRLRALAEAANVARRKMILDVGDNGYFIRIPAGSWASLSVAIADAAMDRDNKYTVPVPTPRPRRLDDDYEHLPKPSPA